MSHHILSGSPKKVELFIANFIDKNNIQSHEIQKYTEKIRVEDARSIRKSLSLKIQGQRLILFQGQLTIECQNALLKCIEEAHQTIYFIFCVNTTEEVLPTIRSRCIEKMLGQDDDYDKNIYVRLKGFGINDPHYGDLDILLKEAEDKGIDQIIIALRKLMLESIDFPHNALKYQEYCRSLLERSNLWDRNNVSMSTVLEQTFILN